MATDHPHTSWPPPLTDTQLHALTLLATTYALSHGLVYLPPGSTQPPTPAAAIHAPLALLPAPVPRALFHRARALQATYNLLYARVAANTEFLDRVMGAEVGAGRADAFTGALWAAWRRVRARGVAQPLQLGLFRSDYMVHTGEGEPGLKQVEFNTISSSFGTLSERVAAMHRYLYKSTGYYGSSAHLKEENFPPNETTAGLAEGLAAAHKAYGVENARILFVVQDNERNVFDQRWLEYELLEKHSIHVIRQTFDQLATSATIDPESHVLRIASPELPNVSRVEISTVYFRAGYMPTDYPTPAHYDTRFLLESSRAIQCPSIPLQLAGGKKVQEVLTHPGVLESFLSGVSTSDLTLLRESWMEMWSLDVPGGTDRARNEAATLVLKPQREGGGNNVYRDSIPPFVDTLPAAEREAWIAMRLIAPPPQGSYLVRAGAGADTAVRAEVVSELGVFGWALFGSAGGEVQQKEAGWLVRTKGKESDEGGVAAGFSVLDSIVLVD